MIPFEELKSDLLAHYGRTICKEARDEIEQSTNIEQAFGVLHKYLVYLGDRQIPNVEWLRKWFADNLHTLNKCGMYLDQKTILHNPPHKSIILYGHSEITFVLDNTEFYHITTQDNAVANLIAREWSICHLHTKGNSRAELLHKGENAKVKIRQL